MSGSSEPSPFPGETAEDLQAWIADLENTATQLSQEELISRITALKQEQMGLNNASRTNRLELGRLKQEEKVASDQIKQNSKLPYLVANIAEVLDVPHEDEEGKVIRGVIVKASNRQTGFLPHSGFVDVDKLKPDDLVGVHRDTLLIYETLPTQYDSRVRAMEVDERPKEQYSDVGGLDSQLQEMIETVVLPFTHKDLYAKIGITPPKGALLFGAPGTGKTMLARACANATKACFLKLAGPQLVQMYIGDGSRLIRDTFALARQKAPAIIFIDELDAVGMRRGSEDEKTGSREVQRTMLELLAQLDGFDSSANVKVIAATNRIDVLDPALLRSGRLDRKIEFKLPDVKARQQILEIHSRKMVCSDDVIYEEIARSTEDMNGAQLKAVTVEAGMLALKHNRLMVEHEDFVEGIAVVLAKKKTALNYFA